MWETVCVPWLTPHRFAEKMMFSLSTPMPYLSPSMSIWLSGLLIKTTTPRAHNTCRVAHTYRVYSCSGKHILCFYYCSRCLLSWMWTGVCVLGVAGLVYLLGMICASMLSLTQFMQASKTLNQVYALALSLSLAVSPTESAIGIWWIHTKQIRWQTCDWHTVYWKEIHTPPVDNL